MNMSLVGGYPQAYAAGPMSHDLYAYPHPAQMQAQPRYDTHPSDTGYFQGWMLNSQSDLGLASDSYGYSPQGGDYGGMLGFMGDGSGPGMRVRCVKRRVTANKKERRRTQSINTAFTNLRDCIPNVPSDTKLSKIKIIPKERRRTQNLNSAFAKLRGSIPNVPQDTKLSKIKTLRLATSYISYLMDVLNKDDPSLVEAEFKAELHKKTDKEKEERKKKELEELEKVESEKCDKSKNKGRTGWPQHVWAAELKQ